MTGKKIKKTKSPSKRGSSNTLNATHGGMRKTEKIPEKGRGVRVDKTGLTTSHKKRNRVKRKRLQVGEINGGQEADSITESETK